MAGLNRVCRELGLILDAGDKAPQICIKIAEFTYGPLSPEQVLELLRKRVREDCEALRLITDFDNKADFLDPNELKSIDDGAADEDLVTEFKKAIKNHVIAHKKAPAGGGGSGAGSSADMPPPDPDEPPAKKPRKYPDLLELGEKPDIEFVKQFLPEGNRVSIDALDKSYRLSSYGVRFSKAWTKFSPNGAALECIKLAWTRAIELGYEIEMPFDLEALL
jgi:hypothetical protein